MSSHNGALEENTNMTRQLVALIGASAAIVSATVFAAEGTQSQELKCPVSGRPAKTEHAVAYKGGQVYFCCPNCPGAFQKSPEKFATKANAQLVASGQAEQVACPLTGAKVNPAASATIDGVEIHFCCKNCQGKITKASEDERRELAFGEKGFAKGFKVKTNEGS
jgi:YHS domain-containing protein